MPPKNKKQAEEQAKRLQEQRKRQEEQQARLELERKKYAGQTLQTGLFLPASNQLILQFAEKPLSFVSQKLTEAIMKAHQNISDEEYLKKVVLKELHYFIKDGRKIFSLQKIKGVEGNQKSLLKVRTFVGIALKLMLNDSPCIGGGGKSRQNDEKLFKEVLASHSVEKKPQKMKVFDKKKEVQDMLDYANKTYFAHFTLMKYHKSFEKRTDYKEYTIHMTVPANYLNSKETPWKDLTQKEEPPKDLNKGEGQNNAD